MKGKYLFWFLAPLILVIILVYYNAFTILNEDKGNFEESSEEKERGFENINPEPREAGKGLTGEIIYRIDASSSEEWVYFDFSNGSVVEIPDRSSLYWDIGFKRISIISNGGETNPEGMGGIMELKNIRFESVIEAPESGYTVDTMISPMDAENPAIKEWYEYSYWTHILKPKNSVYVIRTADGRYAKMQILKYYCGRLPGCYTIKYVYQGNGSRKFY